MVSIHRCGYVVGCLFALCAGTVAAQMECPCAIATELVVTLGDESADGFVGYPLQVSEHDGRYYVVVEDDPAFVRVFEASGEFSQLIGGKGQGPGEFQQIVGIGFPADDVLTVLDRSLRRLTHLRLDRDSVATTSVNMRFWGPQALTVLEGGHFLINAVSGMARNRVLHIVSATGRPPVSFRPEAASDLGSIVMAAQGDDGHILVTPHDRPTVEVWTADGALERTVHPASDWFDRSPVPERGWSVLRDGPLPARMDVAGSPGVIWLLGRIPAEDWRAGVNRNENDVPTNFEATRFYGAIVEAVDPADGRILGRLELHPDDLSASANAMAMRFVDGSEYPTLVVHRILPDGSPRLDLRRLRLIPPQPSARRYE